MRSISNHSLRPTDLGLAELSGQLNCPADRFRAIAGAVAVW